MSPPVVSSSTALSPPLRIAHGDGQPDDAIQHRQTCHGARLYIPITLALLLAACLILATKSVVMLTQILWGLTVLGWVPVMIGFSIKQKNRFLRRWQPLIGNRKPDNASLPFITILLPVMDEAQMMPQLAAAMARLDYPSDKLDCMVLLEAPDRRTPVGALKAEWPDFCRLLSVPAGSPQTKARACNYALRRARGDLLVIFDAEDRPHPQQMREAARRFARHDDTLACLQAPLKVLPQRGDWLENQFALEYALLFTFILPCLGRANGALPLGGTSNYFRLPALRAVGGWDDYNLTEDADLGMRLAQAGYRIDTLNLPTYENAPHRPIIWHRQRTRWLSGHIQTLHTQISCAYNPYRYFWLRISSASILIGRLATIPAHALTVSLLVHNGLVGQLPIASILTFSAGYLIMVILLYRTGPARTRTSRLFFELTHWLYWLCMLPAFCNAAKRMALGQLGWLKSQHLPFCIHEDGAKDVERVKGIEPSS